MATLDIQSIREALSIEQVLEARGVRLRRGRGPCPVCGTSERSTAFSIRDNRWRCFACGCHGDVVDLVATLDQVPLREAFARSARLAGLAPGQAGMAPRRRPKSLWQLSREAADRAWRPYLVAIRTREFVAAEYEGFVRRRGFDHPISTLAGHLLADAYDRETHAEYIYVQTVEVA